MIMVFRLWQHSTGDNMGSHHGLHVRNDRHSHHAGRCRHDRPSHGRSVSLRLLGAVLLRHLRPSSSASTSSAWGDRAPTPRVGDPDRQPAEERAFVEPTLPADADHCRRLRWLPRRRSMPLARFSKLCSWLLLNCIQNESIYLPQNVPQIINRHTTLR